MAASCASVPEDIPTACFVPDVRGDRLLERLDAGAEDEALALVDLGGHAEDLVADGGVLFFRSRRGTGTREER